MATKKKRPKSPRKRKRAAATRERARPRVPEKRSLRKGTDSGRNVGALKKVWRDLERAEQLVIFGGLGLSVTQRLIEECGMTRRVARTFQRTAYEMMLESEEREPRELRLMRYRFGLERQTEAASRDGEHRAAIAGFVALAKMHGGFDRQGIQLPGGRAGNEPSKPRLVAGATEVLSDEDKPTVISAAQLTEELIAARERGEDV